MPSRRARALHLAFRPLERLGVHVTPVHFYQPIPDTRTLPESLWERPSEMPGVNWNGDRQLELVAEFRDRYRPEYDAFPTAPTGDPHRYQLDNPQFSKIDAEALWCMVRSLRPRRFVEIGSGNSTLLTLEALRANEADDPASRCHVTAIEPYPNDVLRAGVPGLDELVVSPVQQVELSVFESLGENDILFVDSSHVLKIGSDVHYEFLEVLPRLQPGVVVQIHDIFLPDEYPRHLVLDWHQFWTEQYLVQAFLAFNDSFEVLWSSAWLHANHSDLLAASFGSYLGMGWPTGMPPASLWLRRVR